MNSATPLPSIFDTQSLATLKRGLRQDDPQALKAAARQFEAVFLQMMLKSMRATVPQDGMFESEQTRFYQELLDSQLAQVMSAKGGTGLAAMIERQMSRTGTEPASAEGSGFPLTPPLPALRFEAGRRSYPLQMPEQVPALPLERGSSRSPLPAAGETAEAARPQDFAANVWPHANAISAATGIPARFFVAHAALESGWGRAVPRQADGSSSYNLFGIKAGSGWNGPVVAASTTEYVNGNAERRTERFRAYGSYAEAFQDYARLLLQSPRYADVLNSRDAAGFARSLQQAGYATDPAYASKLERVIGSLAMRAANSPAA
jgi:flagellar protein FlgJ